MNENYPGRLNDLYKEFLAAADSVGAMIYSLARKVRADAGAGSRC